ncbi:hypothetical protein F6X40_35385 [Paraburkholderia sp. UCT31]|uniref:hypothetical protein n=1 Tax=Paraburkholderia sp. UCT31 TaxID=2615209 RepID=UPI001655120B|nr:hypothetical protein [Paraburkholderia sp. UCT31]MBC8741834.1 hypothetical protein [Paraburkholderia sp. UCT31]
MEKYEAFWEQARTRLRESDDARAAGKPERELRTLRAARDSVERAVAKLPPEYRITRAALEADMQRIDKRLQAAEASPMALEAPSHGAELSCSPESPPALEIHDIGTVAVFMLALVLISAPLWWAALMPASVQRPVCLPYIVGALPLLLAGAFLTVEHLKEQRRPREVHAFAGPIVFFVGVVAFALAGIELLAGVFQSFF